MDRIYRSGVGAVVLVADLVVDGRPVAMPRPRLSFRSVRRGYRSSCYIPDHVRRYQDRVSEASRAAQIDREPPGGGLSPADGPIRAWMDFYLPRPKDQTRKRSANPAIWAPVRPDLTNLAKTVEDALESIWFFDDAQIVELILRKCYAPGPDLGDPGGHLAVTLEALQSRGPGLPLE